MEKNTKKISIKKIILGILGTLIFLVLMFVGYELATVNKQYYKNEKNINIPIFIYHDIVEQQNDEDFMQTTKEKFEKQVSGLLKMGYNFITYNDLIAYYNGDKALKKRTALIDFDDGYTGNYTIALPVIEKYNIPITIFIIDDQVGKSGYLTWDEIRKMDETGLVDFYTHGKYHDEFDKIDVNKAVQDVEYAHGKIEEKLGKKITKVFTYPYGLYSKDMVNALNEKGFVQNLTDSKINNSKKLNLSELHRMYPLKLSPFEIVIKVIYRSIRYGT